MRPGDFSSAASLKDHGIHDVARQPHPSRPHTSHLSSGCPVSPETSVHYELKPHTAAHPHESPANTYSATASLSVRTRVLRCSSGVRRRGNAPGTSSASLWISGVDRPLGGESPF